MDEKKQELVRQGIKQHLLALLDTDEEVRTAVSHIKAAEAVNEAACPDAAAEKEENPAVMSEKIAEEPVQDEKEQGDILANKLTAVKAELAAVQARSAGLEQEKKKLTAECAELKRVRAGLEKLRDEIEAANKALRGECGQLEKKLEALGARYSELEGQLRDLTEERDALKKAKDDLEDAKDALEREKIILTGKNEKLIKSNNQLNEDKNNLNRQLKERFGAGWEQWEAYQGLRAESRGRLGLAQGGFQGFICALAQIYTPKKIWEAADAALKWNDDGEAESLNRLLAYSIELVNVYRQAEQYRLLKAEPGDRYEVWRHQLTADSPNQGVVAEILLAGIEDVYEGKIKCKAVVRLK